MAFVTSEQATVFRGGGRRFMTKRAAYRAEAAAMMRAAFNDGDGCVCIQEPDTGYYETCEWHLACEAGDADGALDTMVASMVAADKVEG